MSGPHRLVRSRTPGFHPGNRGSNPLGVIISEALFYPYGDTVFKLTLLVCFFFSPEVEQDRLQDARFEVDVLDDAFYLLINKLELEKLKNSDIFTLNVESINKFTEEPKKHIGSLCLIKGIVNQVRFRKDSSLNIIEIFLRHQSGEPLMCFYIDKVLPKVGSSIEINGYFWKTIRLNSRNGQEKNYLAFVCFVPRNIVLKNISVKVWIVPLLSFLVVVFLLIKNFKTYKRHKISSDEFLTERYLEDNPEDALKILRKQSEE